MGVVRGGEFQALRFHVLYHVPGAVLSVLLIRILK